MFLKSHETYKLVEAFIVCVVGESRSPPYLKTLQHH